VAKCGWVRAMLRHALPWLGHTRRGSGDARRSLATEDSDSVDSETEWDA